jgi:hypothetical protein
MADGRGPWKFRDVETLWAALERYHFYHESLRVRRLGDRVSGNTVSAIDQPVWEDILRANQAIDRAMVRLAVIAPYLHLLLHHYYRRGLNEDSGGWHEAARKAGCVVHKPEKLARPAFDWMIEQAVWTLFFCHRAPRRARAALDGPSRPV